MLKIRDITSLFPALVNKLIIKYVAVQYPEFNKTITLVTGYSFALVYIMSLKLLL